MSNTALKEAELAHAMASDRYDVANERIHGDSPSDTDMEEFKAARDAVVATREAVRNARATAEASADNGEAIATPGTVAGTSEVSL